MFKYQIVSYMCLGKKKDKARCPNRSAQGGVSIEWRYKECDYCCQKQEQSLILIRYSVQKRDALRTIIC